MDADELVCGDLAVRRIQMPGTAAVTILVAFDAGSRSERPAEHGVAHLLEHMVFKGGETFSSHRAVNGETDRLGARLNAFTSQELVAFHVRVRAERGRAALELLTDVLGRPRISAGELAREQGVVVQEIARSDDQPASRALDLSGSVTFGDHPLGRTVLGTERSVRSLTPETVSGFRARRWSGQRGIALLVGNSSDIDDHSLTELLARLPEVRTPEPHAPPPLIAPSTTVEQRDSSQTHLVLTWRPELDVVDARVRAAFSVYAMLLGGSMGSRLVSEIREDLGLAYSVRADADALSDATVLYVTAGLDSDNLALALERCCEIVGELARSGVRSEEIDRARSAAAGRRALAFENTTLAASHLAEEHVLHAHGIDPLGAVAELDGVTDDEVREVAAAVLGSPSIACVGPHDAGDLGS